MLRSLKIADERARVTGLSMPLRAQRQQIATILRKE
jgi:hypothetical protein